MLVWEVLTLHLIIIIIIRIVKYISWQKTFDKFYSLQASADFLKWISISYIWHFSRMTQRRVIEAMDADTITYRRVDDLVFDEEASYPYSVNDTVTLVNAAYHVSTIMWFFFYNKHITYDSFTKWLRGVTLNYYESLPTFKKY